MPTQTINIPMPAKGLVRNVPNTYLETDYAADAINVLYRDGEIRPRPGYTIKGGQLSGALLAMFTHKELSGQRQLLAMTTTKMYRYSVANDAWVELTLPGGMSALNGTPAKPVSTCSIAHAGGSLATGYYTVITNSVDQIMVYDITNGLQFLSSDAMLARHVMSFKSSLILFNVTEAGINSPQKVMWSETGVIDNFNASTSNAGFKFAYDTPGDIRSAAFIGDSIAIYKSDAIVPFSYTGGTDLFAINNAVATTSLVSSGALVTLEGYHIYLAHDNIYKWSGGSMPIAIGDQVYKKIHDSLNWDYIESSRAILDKERRLVWFFFPTGTSQYPTSCGSYDYSARIWSEHKFQDTISAVGTWDQYDMLTWEDVPATITWEDIASDGDDTQTVIALGATWSDLAPVEKNVEIILGTSDGYVYQMDNDVYMDALDSPPTFTQDGSVQIPGNTDITGITTDGATGLITLKLPAGTFDTVAADDFAIVWIMQGDNTNLQASQYWYSGDATFHPNSNGSTSAYLEWPAAPTSCDIIDIGDTTTLSNWVFGFNKDDTNAYMYQDGVYLGADSGTDCDNLDGTHSTDIYLGYNAKGTFGFFAILDLSSASITMNQAFIASISAAVHASTLNPDSLQAAIMAVDSNITGYYWRLDETVAANAKITRYVLEDATDYDADTGGVMSASGCTQTTIATNVFDPDIVSERDTWLNTDDDLWYVAAADDSNAITAGEWEAYTANGRYHYTPFIVLNPTDYQDRYIRFLGLKCDIKGGTERTGTNDDTVTIKYRTDYSGSWTELSNSPYTTTNDWEFVQFDMSITAKRIQFCFDGGDSDKPFFVRQFSLKVAQRGTV